MTDQESAATAATAAAEEARDNRAHRLFTIFGIAGAIFVILSCGISVWALLHSGQQGAQIKQLDGQISRLIDTNDNTAKKTQQLADQIVRLGATPVVQPVIPAPSGPTIVPVPVGPTQEQIDAVVAAQLAAHPPAPGKNATPAMVAAIVADFLTANPPQPGRPPTPEEIATAASNYIAAHASDFRGASGAAGKDATDAQVKASVAAYCDAHNSCAGPKGDSVQGPQGSQGVSFTDLQFRRDGLGTCQAIAYFHDPATGKNSTVTHSAGDAACPVSTVAPLIPTR
jgi:hypothetical protein